MQPQGTTCHYDQTECVCETERKCYYLHQDRNAYGVTGPDIDSGFDYTEFHIVCMYACLCVFGQ